MTGITKFCLGRIRGISELPIENCFFGLRVGRGVEAYSRNSKQKEKHKTRK